MTTFFKCFKFDPYDLYLTQNNGSTCRALEKQNSAKLCSINRVIITIASLLICIEMIHKYARHVHSPGINNPFFQDLIEILILYY